MKKLAAFIASVLLVATSGAYAASMELTLVDIFPGQEVQQTENNPCVIGDNSCKNVLDYEVIDASDVTAGQWNLSSPVYAVDDIVTLMGGNTFWIGIDVNKTGNSQEILDYFQVWVDGVEVFYFGANGDGNVGSHLAQGNDLRNGTGWSDFLLTGIDLSTLTILADSTIEFRAGMDQVGNGQEQFFLVRIDSPIGEVPLPAAAWLFLSGLVGLAGLRKSSKQ